MCTATNGQSIGADHWPCGDAVGVTALDGADAGPVPTLLVADTVKVYEVPLVRLGTCSVVAEPLSTIGVCAAAPANGVIV
ncbi:hypothetical protein CLV40_11411 [Actinokineospora auranticolor]|uniref:Uncharacterized protein n=1 Tax=Actinokineospora auranticolor TaxID=155976 RepID=A0A2S6GJG4_9PSEU|nr:hypothetical protein CLV40_11411 [Actinokineospora auranticolor]